MRLGEEVKKFFCSFAGLILVFFLAGAESLLQLPSGGESLTAIVRRGLPKLLQPAPAFSSTAAKAPSVGGGGSGSSRNSRILTTIQANDGSTTTNISHGGSDTNPHRKIHPAISNYVPRPRNIDRSRTVSSRKPAQAVHSDMVKSGKDPSAIDPFAGRLRRQLSVDPDDIQEGLRKRSVSFPANVQALVDEMTSLILPREVSLTSTTKGINGQVSTTASSLATNSASNTPNTRRSHKFMTPIGTERSRPVSQPPMLDSSTDSLTIAASRPSAANRSQKNSPQKQRQGRNSKIPWEESEATPFLTAPQSASSSLSSVKASGPHPGGGNHELENDDEYESNGDESPVPRKRSLSCGDAAMMSNGPTHQLPNGSPATAYSEPQHVRRAPTIHVNTPNHVPSSGASTRSSVSSLGAQSAPVSNYVYHRNRNRDFSHHDPVLTENLEEDSPSDSPLLLRPVDSGSAGCVATPVERRRRKKPKSAASLQNFSKPLFISGQLTSEMNGSGGEDESGIPAAGGANKLTRILRYLKRPLSDDPLCASADGEKRTKQPQHQISLV